MRLIFESCRFFAAQKDAEIQKLGSKLRKSWLVGTPSSPNVQRGVGYQLHNYSLQSTQATQTSACQ